MAVQKHKKNESQPLKNQAEHMLKSKMHAGESKHYYKLASPGKTLPHVFAWATFSLYLGVCICFFAWAEATYGSFLFATDYSAFAPIFLRLKLQTCQPTTVATYACALAKLFNCHMGDFGVKIPPRCRADSFKHLSLDWVGSFDPRKYSRVYLLSMATGCRRHELPRITVDMITIHRDGSVWIHGVKGKGGRYRNIPVLPEYWEAVLRLRAEAIAAGRKRLLPRLRGVKAKHYVPANMPCHQNRAMYAIRLYDLRARPVEGLDRSETYHCRKDMAGIVFDRHAMKYVSEALGHSRLGVVTRYLRPEFREVMAIRKASGLL